MNNVVYRQHVKFQISYDSEVGFPFMNPFLRHFLSF